MHFKLVLSYDGTRYLGWMKNRDLLTVERELELALAQVLGEMPILEAASRTDRGVHAIGQVVKVTVERGTDPHRLFKALNGLLPDDIAILSVEETSDAFHPSLDATAKEYIYRVCLGPVQLPFHAPYSWHLHETIDLEAMHREAARLVGTHDFSAYTTKEAPDTIRTLHRITVTPQPHNRLEISILGDRFLYKMARALVGRLLYVGIGDKTLDKVTAPAHGLTLQRVLYSSMG